MKTIIQKFISIWAMGVLITGCAVAAGPASDFSRFYRQNNLQLPSIILYKEFLKAASAAGMTDEDVRAYFEENDVPIKGEGDAGYLGRNDLLRVCGEECTPQDGLGYILTKLLVVKHQR